MRLETLLSISNQRSFHTLLQNWNQFDFCIPLSHDEIHNCNKAFFAWAKVYNITSCLRTMRTLVTSKNNKSSLRFTSTQKAIVLLEESSILSEDTNVQILWCSQRWEDEQKHNANLHFEFGDKCSEEMKAW